MKKSVALGLFLSVVLADIVAILTHNETLEFIAKPLLMVSLATFYLLSVKKANFWYVSALFFSFWGDTLLLFDNRFFVLGLGAFLTAHVLFITLVSRLLKPVKISLILAHSAPFVLYLLFLLWLIAPNLQGLLYPVMMYGIVISVFGVVSFLLYSQAKATANLWLFLGSLIFILSDSVLAVNKFYQTNELYGIVIMITYILAQFLICKAIVAKSD